MIYLLYNIIYRRRSKNVRKKDVAVNAVVYFVFVILSCVFARIFSNMAVKLVDLFVELQFISASGVRVVTLMLFSAFFIVFIFFKYGYHVAYFDMNESLISALLSVAVHFLLSFVTVFSPWVAGATKHIGGFVAFGDNYTSAEHMMAIPMVTLIMIGVLMALLYAGLLVVGTHNGVKKRLSDRAELMGDSDSEAK